MRLAVLMGACAAGVTISSCATPPNARDVAFVQPPGFRSCPAERAVDWDASLGWVDEPAITAGNAEYSRRFDDLTGDDVAVYYESGGDVENFGLAVRREGEWVYQTAQGPDYRAPPPLPAPPGPDGSPPPPERYSCTGPHLKARGRASDRLETALEAFLGDGCRAYLPVLVPAPLTLRDPDARTCGYGTTAQIIVETASGVQHYAQTCPVPGSTLAELVHAFNGARRPENPRFYGPEQTFSAVLNTPPSESRRAAACREIAETRGYNIDFEDPFTW